MHDVASLPSPLKWPSCSLLHYDSVELRLSPVLNHGFWFDGAYQQCAGITQEKCWGLPQERRDGGCEDTVTSPRQAGEGPVRGQFWVAAPGSLC